MRIMIILFLFFPVMAFAEVHKCVNDGHVSYSGAPCVSGAVPFDADNLTTSESDSRIAYISRGVGGVFITDGAVNGHSVRFLVDTGASFTTLSGDTAYRLGVKSCAPVGVVSTASGAAVYCRVMVSRLDVAGFNFSNVSVVISPGMRGHSLFGNDLLGKFKIEQRGDMLILSK